MPSSTSHEYNGGDVEKMCQKKIAINGLHVILLCVSESINFTTKMALKLFYRIGNKLV